MNTQFRSAPARVLLILILLLTSIGFAFTLGSGSSLEASAAVAVPDQNFVPDNNTAQPLPLAQNWSNAGLITANDDWSGVPGIEGFLGDDPTTTTGIDPRTIVAPYTTIDVIANQANPNTQTTGGVAEFDGIPDPVVALQGSGTADFPHVAFYVNTTGQSNIRVQYNVRDIDGSADNAIQQVNLQYRIGNTGDFTNVTGGYIADATTGPSLATLVTPIDVILPAAANNQSRVELRVMTTNAVGSDEWVGIDDINISVGVIGTPTSTFTPLPTITPGGPTATNTPIPPSATATASPTITPPPVRIRQIQGAQHISPLNGQTVNNVPGIVTELLSNGFYMQDPTSDANDVTSEGIFVFTSSAPAVVLGDSVAVAGTVSEFRPGGAATNLTTTEIGSPVISHISSGNPQPAAIVIGTGGRIPPNTIINNDSTGDVETSGIFDPAEDGIDFYESLEGMRVQINNPVAVGPTNSFGELPVVGDNGANASVRTNRGGIVIQPTDFNPERIILAGSAPQANVGDHFSGPAIGVMEYNFGLFMVFLTQPLTTVSSGLAQEVTTPQGTNQLAIGNFNVENLAPSDPASKFSTLANLIVNNMKSPDILSIEEIQDNSGATDNGVVDATNTWNMLITAIQTAGGPTYQFRSINPVNDQDGGQPGGNIRQGFLFRTDRGVAFIDRPGGCSTCAVTAVSGPSGPELTFSPGRIDPSNPAWNSSRKPLAGEFTYNGYKLFLIGNHFNSKGGDDPLFGRYQPPTRSSEVQRNQQAQVENNFVDSILALDPNANVVALGDLNDFSFSTALLTLKGSPLVLNDLLETLPLPERYTYVFEGNSQDLDHTLLSNNLFNNVPFVFDVVHMNSEFAVQASDHEGQVVRLTLAPAATVTPTTNATSTRTATTTSTSTATRTATSTSTTTSTSTRTSTSTSTTISTNTPTRTSTNTPVPPTATGTNTQTNTPVPTNTLAPTSTGTSTSTGTITAAPTSTRTNTAMPSSTRTNTATATNTTLVTSTRTNTPTVVASSTNVATGTVVASPTSAATFTTAPSTQTPGESTATTAPSGTASLSTATAIVTATACTITFSDVPANNTFYSYIRCLACRGIISGYDDGTFRPGNDITRGQIAKIVSNAAGFSEDPGPQDYEDVPVGSPFYAWVNRLSNRGFMGGYECGLVPEEPCTPPNNYPYFRPNAPASRGQLSKIVANAAGLIGTPTDTFYTDVEPGHPFYLWIMRLTTLGVMSGYDCGGPNEPCDSQNRPYFRPYNNVTRGQASKIVANTFLPGCLTPVR